MLESTAAVLQQSRQAEEDFEVKAERTLNYEDGSAKLMGVRVERPQARAAATSW